MNMKRINKELDLYFNRCYRLEQLEKLENNARPIPEEIKARFQSSYKKSVEILNSLGFDIDKFMNSSKGQAIYLEFCSTKDHYSKIQDRCSRCLNYEMRDYDEIPLKCCKSSEFPRILCSDFKDSGMDFTERLLKYVTNRCNDCKRLLNKQYTEIEDIDKIRCELNLNRLAENCESFSHDKG